MASRLIAVSSSVASVSSTATGAGLFTVQVKVASSVPPLPSSTVTVTLYGPPCDALKSMVPVISPVAGSIDRPGGRSVAE